MARQNSYLRADTSRRARRGGDSRRWLRRLIASRFELLAMLIAMACVAYVGAQFLAKQEMVPVTPAARGAEVSLNFSLCSGSVRTTCVVDGDTLWISGAKIRIADIDTPEVFSPKCGAERALGTKATRRLQELLNAGPIEIAGYERDADVYGRKLRIIRRDGRSIGAMLVAEGLARPWDGARHSWC